MKSKKSKLTLAQLDVKSFTTSLASKDVATVKGGSGHHTCVVSDINPFPTAISIPEYSGFKTCLVGEILPAPTLDPNECK